MIRLVLDPGVLVSAAIAPAGAPAQLLRAILDGAADLVVSPMLVDELRRVLVRPAFRRYLTVAQAGRYVDVIAGLAVLVQDSESIPRVTRDPDDDYLVALARVSGAVAIVSGDKDLTGLKDLAPPVLTPRQALNRLMPSSRS